MLRDRSMRRVLLRPRRRCSRRPRRCCAAAARGARAAWPVGARRSECYVIAPLRDPECMSWHGATRLDLCLRPCAARARAHRSSATRPSGRWISRWPRRTRARGDRAGFPLPGGIRARREPATTSAGAAGSSCFCIFGCSIRILMRSPCVLNFKCLHRCGFHFNGVLL